MILKRKTVLCPQCGYMGKARVIDRSTPWLISAAAMAGIGFYYYPPVLVLAALALAIAILQPKQQICAQCAYPHPHNVRYTSPQEMRDIVKNVHLRHTEQD